MRAAAGRRRKLDADAVRTALEAAGGLKREDIDYIVGTGAGKAATLARRVLEALIPQAEACGAFFMTGATSGGQWPTLIHRPHLPT